MRNFDLLALSWRNLMRRKSRTILTILSVVIGAVAIILMLSFGYGIQENQRQQIEKFSQLNAIRVSPGNSSMTSGSSPAKADRGLLNDKVVRQIEAMPHVTGVLASSYVPYEVDFEKDGYMMGEVRAIDFSKLRSDHIEMQSGSVPHDTRKDPFIAGPNVELMRMNRRSKNTEFIPHPDWKKEKPLIKYRDMSEETQISIGNQTDGISIALSYAGSFQSSNLLVPSNLYISFDTLDKMDQKVEERQKKLGLEDSGTASDALARGRLMFGGAGSAASQTVKKSGKKKNRNYDSLTVTVDDLSNIEAVVDQINSETTVQAQANADMIEQQQQALQVVQLIFGGIGSIALFVAAIGIANTMLMSIHERTREIGVMKVIGAQVGDIRRMFLLEAMLIGIIGGLIGVVISMGASAGINMLANQYLGASGFDETTYISYIPLWLPFAAFFFSALIGLLAGYLPATRATRISAIEAIRAD